VLRLLDKNRVEQERLQWQLVNMLLPLLMLVLVAWVVQSIRRKKFQQPGSIIQQ
jgi:uncharacterized membrane protein YwzB